ncbi:MULTISPECIES: DUF554 domain-containing protein [Desulfococcus]|uniref:DUF554 domain-containing protein n=1 Tax=Desulfococcus multivorans DSM 2059 TaxID=1121405 RepID=S7TC67_DESML|nr:DUF554 domain-containing protein [Desulfococcus multivorans]AOY59498.1 conserved uncharacterized protein, DUF554 [Desulfococcus multivorans]AQV01697.1 hypothetical protein B2D07_13615 [Desulfococcus multivorans]EPR34145.1 protein of unknown function DUF554 [Desulfococcus multivorans DSM 2059]MDX9818182.1 DUF554 domain-containing protein [Desulfococcus multivorans]SKA19431.1 hypothetical protein SAMN02745446_03182 [Desulfococcus multivorans DSM 2059]
MLGTLVNTLAIVCGALAGLLLRGGAPEKYTSTVMHAISLAVILIGLKGAIDTPDILLVIFSLAIGSVIGEMLRIEERLERFGNRLERRFSKEEGGFSKGFVAASLLFCVGSMAIVGAMESGLTGDHKTLYAKSVLDGVAAVVFGSTFGIGVLFSAVSVFCYQGFITFTATLIKPFLVPAVVSQMSAVGGLLIMAIGFNMLEIKRIKVGNMLPAIFIPLAYYIVRRFAPF